MKCINCGQEMQKAVSVKGLPITVYVCPNRAMILAKTPMGYSGNIYCDEKKETKKDGSKT